MPFNSDVIFETGRLQNEVIFLRNFLRKNSHSPADGRRTKGKRNDRASPDFIVRLLQSIDEYFAAIGQRSVFFTGKIKRRLMEDCPYISMDPLNDPKSCTYKLKVDNSRKVNEYRPEELWPI